MARKKSGPFGGLAAQDVADAAAADVLHEGVEAVAAQVLQQGQVHGLRAVVVQLRGDPGAAPGPGEVAIELREPGDRRLDIDGALGAGEQVREARSRERGVPGRGARGGGPGELGGRGQGGVVGRRLGQRGGRAAVQAQGLQRLHCRQVRPLRFVPTVSAQDRGNSGGSGEKRRALATSRDGPLLDVGPGCGGIGPRAKVRDYSADRRPLEGGKPGGTRPERSSGVPCLPCNVRREGDAGNNEAVKRARASGIASRTRGTGAGRPRGRRRRIPRRRRSGGGGRRGGRCCRGGRASC